MTQCEPSYQTAKPGSPKHNDSVEAAQWMRWALEGVFEGGAKYSELAGLTQHNINSAIEIFELLAGNMPPSAKLVRPLAKAFFILGYANGYGLLSDALLARAREARRGAEGNYRRAFVSWAEATRSRLNGWDAVIGKFRQDNLESEHEQSPNSALATGNELGIDNSIIEGLVAGWYWSNMIERPEDQHADVGPQTQVAEIVAQPAVVANGNHAAKEPELPPSGGWRKDEILDILGCFRDPAPAIIEELDKESRRILKNIYPAYLALRNQAGWDGDEVVYEDADLAVALGVPVAKIKADRRAKTIPRPMTLSDAGYCYNLLQVAAIQSGFTPDLCKADMTRDWYNFLYLCAVIGVDPALALGISSE